MTKHLPERLAVQQQPTFNVRVWNRHDNWYWGFRSFKLSHAFVEAAAIRIRSYNYEIRVSTLSFQVAQIITELADNLTVTPYGIAPIESDGNSVAISYALNQGSDDFLMGSVLDEQRNLTYQNRPSKFSRKLGAKTRVHQGLCQCPVFWPGAPKSKKHLCGFDDLFVGLEITRCSATGPAE